MENQTPKEDIVSRPNHLKLVQTGIEVCAGLNYENGALMVVFGDNKIIEASGDQETGKTSFMNAIMMLLGLGTPENAINSKTKSKSLFQDFIKDGVKYRVKATTSSFTLHTITDTKDGEVLGKLDSPMNRVQKLIGPVGVSPEFIKKKKSGEEQIEWIKKLSVTGDAKVEEDKLKKSYKESYDLRTPVNAEFDRCKQELTSTPFYVWDTVNYVMLPTDVLEKAEQEIAEAPPANTINETYNELDKKRQTFEHNNTKLEVIKETKKTLIREVEELELKLKAKREELNTCEERIVNGTKAISEINYVPTDYETAKKNQENAATIALKQKAVADAKATFLKFDEAEKSKTRINNMLSDIEGKLKELAKKYTPPIEGLEIITTNIDDTKKEGVYLNGMNIAWLSESRLWDFCLQIWKLQGVSVVFIENITSLGSHAIERINWFTENGGYCFLSTMQRDYKELKISFLKELK